MKKQPLTDYEKHLKQEYKVTLSEADRLEISDSLYHPGKAIFLYHQQKLKPTQ